MDIWGASELAMFVAFVIPGFISLKTYEALSPGIAKDSSQQVIDAVAYSCVNYGLLAVPVALVESSACKTSHPSLYLAFWAFVLLVAPITWACAFWKLRHLQFVQKTLPHPVGKPWDYVFSQRKPYWVILTLKGDRQVAGRYDSDSFASSSPQSEQIYLQEAWVLNGDGGFERPRDGTAGVIVLGSEIVTLELFDLTKRKPNERQEAPARGIPTPGEEGLPARQSVGAETAGRPSADQ